MHNSQRLPFFAESDRHILSLVLAPCCHSDDEAGCLMPYGDLHNYWPPPEPHVVDLLDEDNGATAKEMLGSNALEAGRQA